MKKILTTEDGYDIFPGEKYYSVRIVDQPITEEYLKNFPIWFQKSVVKNNPDGIIHAYKNVVGPYLNPKATDVSAELKYFKLKENAEKFIEKNNN